MDANDVDTAIHELKMIAGINQRYHQKLAFLWGLVDKGIKISVGLVAVWGVALSTAGPAHAGLAMTVGWISLGIAVALNVIPTGDYVKDNTDLFRRWSDLYLSAHMIKTRFDIEGADKASPEVRSRIAEAKEIEQTLHATQTAPIRWLLNRCEREEIRAVYGVDTFAEAHNKLWPSLPQTQAASAVVAAVAGSEMAEAGH